jgi:hypothetical protein
MEQAESTTQQVDKGERGWMRGADEGNRAEGGTVHVVGFEVMDLLNLFRLRRGI